MSGLLGALPYLPSARGGASLTSLALRTPGEKHYIHACTYSRTRGCCLCVCVFDPLFKRLLGKLPPSRIRVFVYSSLNHLMEKAGVGRGGEILTENQSEMKMDDLQGVPVGQ